MTEGAYLDHWPSWPGETVAILGGGPSLTREQVEYCRGKCRVIAVNRAYAWAPWADILYAHDKGFWAKHVESADFPPVLEFAGLKLTRAASMPGVLRAPRADRFEDLREGKIWHRFDSGHDAVQIAEICGAGRILLLGFDGRANGHWHGGYAKKQTLQFDKVRQSHRDLAPFLTAQVLNCTPGSEIDAYPMARLEDVL